MKLFLDTANLTEIEEGAASGLISGVTTNPALAAKEGQNFDELLWAILRRTEGPVFAEVISMDVDGMVTDGKRLADFDKERIVVKIPAVWNGFQAARRLRDAGIRTAITLVYSPAQALMASVAGADYVAPFLGRANDVGIDGFESLRQIARQYRHDGAKTQILAASVRTAQDGFAAALAGADILTANLKVIRQMASHPQTDITLKAFLDDWKRIENL